MKDWDYASPGAYFVTICAKDRGHMFGDVMDDVMVLNGIGHIVHEEWIRSSEIRDELEMDKYVVMPNHIHGIVILKEVHPLGRGLPHRGSVGAHGRAPLHRKPRSLGSFVAGFKSRTTKRINQYRNTHGVIVWQRGYYDHIIRDAQDLHNIRRYIQDNPLNWALDPYHSGA